MTLWSKYGTVNISTKDIQEFFFACRILSYDEHTFEKKCALEWKELSNLLQDGIDVRSAVTIEIQRAIVQKRTENLSSVSHPSSSDLQKPS